MELLKNTTDLKGKLAFIAQDYHTRKGITVLENNRQATIKNYFFLRQRLFSIDFTLSSI
ncbi:hypothetical protein SORDD16_01097 [Streptococcus oralis]|uniref:Uncharacterized protein n=1 Tax=Streptococcus oralis TaxID=1303 RepID=A0A139PCV0_STROR|nr:hypothetical protein SORDD16_01097 [Streptococcus oralis]